MRLEDLDRVTAIDQASFTVPWSRRQFENQLLETHYARMWVAVDEEQEDLAAGAVVTWLVAEQLHIATLSVHPDYRRQGIGRQLLRTALLDGLARGAELATLEVRESNLAAQALYRGFHFEVAGRRRRYYLDNQEDALIMTLGHLRAEDIE
jgi:ribosomal-protein-alanine N-acetyltransferase